MYEAEITKDIINVGADDDNITLFENQYDLPDGMAYNSYLILDEKTVVIDSVDKDVCDIWLGNLDKYLAGRTPDAIIVQHMEPDHSGSLAAFAKKYPDAAIYTSQAASNMIKQFFDTDLSAHISLIKDGDTLELGTHCLRFVAAPMVHWPEVMMSYDATSGILFSADAFGKFGVKGAEADDWACEARRYYFNIVGKYGTQVQAVLKKLEGLNLTHICALHGPVLPENEPLEFYLEKYKTWSSYEPETPGVALVFASIHDQGTRQAAERIAELLKERNIKTGVTDLTKDDLHEGVEDAFRYNRMIVCASSYDADLFPPMRHFLDILRIKAYQKRRVPIVENGSWAPTAGRVMKQYFEGMKEIEIVDPLVTIRSTLKEENVPQLEAMLDALLK